MMATTNRYACLIIVVPDGRVLLQRSAWGANTVDYNRAWKCTLLNKMNDLDSTGTLNQFSKSALGIDFVGSKLGDHKLEHIYKPDAFTIINIYSLTLNDGITFTGDRTQMLAVPFEKALFMANDKKECFFHRSRDVLNLMDAMFGGINK